MILPKGFRAAGVACGLKPSGNPDVGLIVSDRDAAVAGVFTVNRVKAAPVLITRARVASGRARAIVVNSGNANACTGSDGHATAVSMASHAARAAGVPDDAMLVASTGIIGVPLPIETVARGIDDAATNLSQDGVDAFARAIMTTDTVPKVADAQTDDGARVVGFAKGAGMIAPEMATMLAFVLSDAPVAAPFLSDALEGIVGSTFNAVSVDGCCSTNDTLLVLANGAAGGEPIEDGSDPRAEPFLRALREVCMSLSKQIVEDGEGATKVVTIEVRNARDARDARAAARSVADSVLFRCAVNGGDPNWGRILSAVGMSGAEFDPDAVDVLLGGELLCSGGSTGPGDKAIAAKAMEGRYIDVVIDLHAGTSGATMLTNDLSAEYVRINAEYTT